MSNSIIPNFLPPAYDFTTEEDDTEEEEEEEEKYDYESLANNVFTGVLLALAFYGLMNIEVNVEFKFSVSKKKQIVRSLKQNLSKT